MAEEKRNDEIDLIEVFQKLGNWIINIFKWFINLLYRILLFFIRRAILIGIIIIIAVAFGFYQYKTSDRYYSSSLEAYSNAMSSIDMINYINNLYALFEENDTTALKSKLKLSSSELEQVKNIKAYKVIDYDKDGVTDKIDFEEKALSSDTIVSMKRFVIKVEVYNQDIIPTIQDRVVNFINTNDYITKLNTIRRRQLSELMDKINLEMNVLDSLKKTEYFKKDESITPKSGQLLIMNEKTTQLYHPQIIAMYKERQNLESELELKTDPITIIQDFSSLSTVENDLFSYIKFYGIIGLVLSILIAIIIENLKVIRSIIIDSRKK